MLALQVGALHWLTGCRTLGTMSLDTLIRPAGCENARVAAVDPSEEFLAAARAYVSAVEEAERRRKELAPLVAKEVARGVKLSRVGKETTYTPEHVRRIARDHGVEATVKRVPPHEHRAAASDPEDD